MSLSTITYSNKTDLNTTAVPDINKVKAADMNEIKSVVNAAVGAIGENSPTGMISLFAGSTAPTGWLICDGTAVSRTTYADLFTAIGTTYGTGDGSTTFNLPNLKGKVPVGLDSTDTSFDALGETGGEKAHILTINEMPNHNHGIRTKINDWVTSTPAIQYGGTGNGFQVLDNAYEGGGGSHNNLQPYIVMNYIIKY